MWFQVIPADIGFTEISPCQFVNEALIAASPERVFEIMTTGEGQREWFKDFVSFTWTSSPPHGAGSTREVELKALSVKERFLVWEPGRRLTFCMYAVTLPLITRMVEDLKFEPAGEKSTRLVWVAHYEPTLLTRLVHPIVRRIFDSLFQATIEGLKRYAEGR